MQNQGKPPVNPEDLGIRIREARELRKLSQEELARAVNKDQRAISQYERGDRKLSAVDLVEFAQVLEMPILYFYTGQSSLDNLDQHLLELLHTLPSPQAKETALQLLRLYAESLRQHLA